MELQSSHIIYDGLSHNTDCLAFCNNNADLNEILEGIMDFVDTCELTIPSCFTDPVHSAGAIIADNTLTSILQGLLTQSCLGWVKVSALDPCWDVLGSKFSSDDGSVLITYPFDAGGCQFIDLSVTPTSVDTSIVKYASLNKVTSTSASINLKSKLITAGTLLIPGDSLLIEAYVDQSTSSMTPPVISLFFGSNSIIFPNFELFLGSRIQYRLTVLDGTTVFITGEIQNTLAPLVGVLATETLTYVNPGTSYTLDYGVDFTIGINSINVGGEIINCNYLIIDKFSA